jgi:hypothetical protein
MSRAPTKAKDAKEGGGRTDRGEVDGETLQGLEAPSSRERPGAALEDGDTSSRSQQVLDGEPADEPQASGDRVWGPARGGEAVAAVEWGRWVVEQERGIGRSD